jgi:hypothetical protein
VGYADAQAFGYAALFGMVVDLKLFDIPLVNGIPDAAHISLHKYSFASGMPQLGSLVVSSELLLSNVEFSR